MKTISQKNNFDFIRLFLALGVFLYHTDELTQIPDFRIFGMASSAAIAVHAFFIVSGFLIFMSYERSSSLKRYFSKRIRRIAPGYIAVILLSFLFLSLLSTLPLKEYFSTSDSIRYLLANLTTLNFLHPTLPGVFEDHHYTAVNGALWTIKIEVAFYFIVPLIVYFIHRFKPVKVLLLIFVFSALYFFAMSQLYRQEHHSVFLVLQRQLPGQMMLFSMGALLYYYFDWFKRYSTLLLAAAIFIYLVQNFTESELLYPLYTISLSIMVIYLALVFPYIGHISRYGDLSYGIYIWHFPMIQTFISLHLFDKHPMIAFLGLTILILFLAWLSWHIIEKPFLGKRSHYVLESEETR